ncbi:hypothetical protein GH733_004401 [Mirounga leonina]|nr:hypothetical protein GH733_004401 [Mirounga leonina]
MVLLVQGTFESGHPSRAQPFQTETAGSPLVQKVSIENALQLWPESPCAFRVQLILGEVNHLSYNCSLWTTALIRGVPVRCHSRHTRSNSASVTLHARSTLHAYGSGITDIIGKFGINHNLEKAQYYHKQFHLYTMKKCSLLDHKEVVEVDLATSWVVEETLEVVVTLAVVETLVEEKAIVAEVVAAEVVMEEVMVDIMDLEVMVATMAMVLVIDVEEAMEGVMVATKDVHMPKHPELADKNVPNLHVMKAMQSLKSRGYVKEQFAWRHFYWYLTNEGIQYLHDHLHLPPEIVPATLSRSRPETGQPRPKGVCDHAATTTPTPLPRTRCRRRKLF